MCNYVVPCVVMLCFCLYIYCCIYIALFLYLFYTRMCVSVCNCLCTVKWNNELGQIPELNQSNLLFAIVCVCVCMYMYVCFIPVYVC